MVFSKPPFTFFPSFYHIRSCPNAHPERKCGNQTRRTGCFSPFHAISWWLCRRYGAKNRRASGTAERLVVAYIEAQKGLPCSSWPQRKYTGVRIGVTVRVQEKRAGHSATQRPAGSSAS